MWPNPQETADLATFTDEILNGELRSFLCSVTSLEIWTDVPFKNTWIYLYWQEYIQKDWQIEKIELEAHTDDEQLS